MNLLILLILIIQKSSYSILFSENIFSLLSLKFKINFLEIHIKCSSLINDLEII